MFDYRALVILMTLMDHCELSLYELSVNPNYSPQI